MCIFLFLSAGTVLVQVLQAAHRPQHVCRDACFKTGSDDIYLVYFGTAPHHVRARWSSDQPCEKSEALYVQQISFSLHLEIFNARPEARNRRFLWRC